MKAIMFEKLVHGGQDRRLRRVDDGDERLDGRIREVRHREDGRPQAAGLGVARPQAGRALAQFTRDVHD